MSYYYVDSLNGNDSFDGGSLTANVSLGSGPFKTIQKGIDSITGGDYLFIRGGTQRVYNYETQGLTTNGSAGTSIATVAGLPFSEKRTIRSYRSEPVFVRGDRFFVDIAEGFLDPDNQESRKQWRRSDNDGTTGGLAGNESFSNIWEISLTGSDYESVNGTYFLFDSRNDRVPARAQEPRITNREAMIAPANQDTNDSELFAPSTGWFAITGNHETHGASPNYWGQVLTGAASPLAGGATAMQIIAPDYIGIGSGVPVERIPQFARGSSAAYENFLTKGWVVFNSGNNNVAKRRIKAADISTGAIIFAETLDDGSGSFTMDIVNGGNLQDTFCLIHPYYIRENGDYFYDEQNKKFYFYDDGDRDPANLVSTPSLDNGFVHRQNGGNVEYYNLRFYGFNQSGIKGSSVTPLAPAYGASGFTGNITDLRIENCEFDRCGFGVQIVRGLNCTVRANYMHHLTDENAVNMEEGYGNTVEYNFTEYCGRSGYKFSGEDTLSVQFNTIVNSKGAHSNAFTFYAVETNYRDETTQEARGCRNVEMIGNIVMGCNLPMAIARDANNFLIRDNIFAKNFAPIQIRDNCSGIKIYNNLFDGGVGVFHTLKNKTDVDEKNILGFSFGVTGADGTILTTLNGLAGATAFYRPNGAGTTTTFAGHLLDIASALPHSSGLPAAVIALTGPFGFSENFSTSITKTGEQFKGLFTNGGVLSVEGFGDLQVISHSNGTTGEYSVTVDPPTWSKVSNDFEVAYNIMSSPMSSSPVGLSGATFLRGVTGTYQHHNLYYSLTGTIGDWIDSLIDSHILQNLNPSDNGSIFVDNANANLFDNYNANNFFIYHSIESLGTTGSGRGLTFGLTANPFTMGTTAASTGSLNGRVGPRLNTQPGLDLVFNDLYESTPGLLGINAQPWSQYLNGKPPARWDAVPWEVISEPKNIGLLAFHGSDIEKVEFFVDDVLTATKTVREYNPQTKVDEFWFELDPGSYTAGSTINVSAKVYSNNGTIRYLNNKSPEGFGNGILYQEYCPHPKYDTSSPFGLSYNEEIGDVGYADDQELCCYKKLYRGQVVTKGAIFSPTTVCYRVKNDIEKVSFYDYGMFHLTPTNIDVRQVPDHHKFDLVKTKEGNWPLQYHIAGGATAEIVRYVDCTSLTNGAGTTSDPMNEIPITHTGNFHHYILLTPGIYNLKGGSSTTPLCPLNQNAWFTVEGNPDPSYTNQDFYITSTKELLGDQEGLTAGWSLYPFLSWPTGFNNSFEQPNTRVNQRPMNIKFKKLTIDPSICPKRDEFEGRIWTDEVFFSGPFVYLFGTTDTYQEYSAGHDSLGGLDYITNCTVESCNQGIINQKNLIRNLYIHEGSQDMFNNVNLCVNAYCRAHIGHYEPGHSDFIQFAQHAKNFIYYNVFTHSGTTIQYGNQGQGAVHDGAFVNNALADDPTFGLSYGKDSENYANPNRNQLPFIATFSMSTGAFKNVLWQNVSSLNQPFRQVGYLTNEVFTVDGIPNAANAARIAREQQEGIVWSITENPMFTEKHSLENCCIVNCLLEGFSLANEGAIIGADSTNRGTKWLENHAKDSWAFTVKNVTIEDDSTDMLQWVNDRKVKSGGISTMPARTIPNRNTAWRNILGNPIDDHHPEYDISGDGVDLVKGDGSGYMFPSFSAIASQNPTRKSIPWGISASSLPERLSNERTYDAVVGFFSNSPSGAKQLQIPYANGADVGAWVPFAWSACPWVHKPYPYTDWIDNDDRFRVGVRVNGRAENVQLGMKGADGVISPITATGVTQHTTYTFDGTKGECHVEFFQNLYIRAVGPTATTFDGVKAMAKNLDPDTGEPFVRNTFTNDLNHTTFTQGSLTPRAAIGIVVDTTSTEYSNLLTAATNSTLHLIKDEGIPFAIENSLATGSLDSKSDQTYHTVSNPNVFNLVNPTQIWKSSDAQDDYYLVSFNTNGTVRGSAKILQVGIATSVVMNPFAFDPLDTSLFPELTNTNPIPEAQTFASRVGYEYNIFNNGTPALDLVAGRQRVFMNNNEYPLALIHEKPAMARAANDFDTSGSGPGGYLIPFAVEQRNYTGIFTSYPFVNFGKTTYGFPVTYLPKYSLYFKPFIETIDFPEDSNFVGINNPILTGRQEAGNQLTVSYLLSGSPSPTAYVEWGKIEEDGMEYLIVTGSNQYVITESDWDTILNGSQTGFARIVANNGAPNPSDFVTATETVYFNPDRPQQSDYSIGYVDILPARRYGSIGEELSVTYGFIGGYDRFAVSPDQPVVGFQWTRDEIAITGETESTYTLTGADEGVSVSCIVSAMSDRGATSESAPFPPDADYQTTRSVTGYVAEVANRLWMKIDRVPDSSIPYLGVTHGCVEPTANTGATVNHQKPKVMMDKAGCPVVAMKYSDDGGNSWNDCEGFDDWSLPLGCGAVSASVAHIPTEINKSGTSTLIAPIGKFSLTSSTAIIGEDNYRYAWFSNDGGKSWRKTNPIPTGNNNESNFIHFVSKINQFIFACTHTRDGIWFSSDEGVSWTRITASLVGAGDPGKVIGVLNLDSGDINSIKVIMVRTSGVDISITSVQQLIGGSWTIVQQNLGGLQEQLIPTIRGNSTDSFIIGSFGSTQFEETVGFAPFDINDETNTLVPSGWTLGATAANSLFKSVAYTTDGGNTWHNRALAGGYTGAYPIEDNSITGMNGLTGNALNGLIASAIVASVTNETNSSRPERSFLTTSFYNESEGEIGFFPTIHTNISTNTNPHVNSQESLDSWRNKVFYRAKNSVDHDTWQVTTPYKTPEVSTNQEVDSQLAVRQVFMEGNVGTIKRSTNQATDIFNVQQKYYITTNKGGLWQEMPLPVEFDSNGRISDFGGAAGVTAFVSLIVPSIVQSSPSDILINNTPLQQTTTLQITGGTLIGDAWEKVGGDECHYTSSTFNGYPPARIEHTWYRITNGQYLASTDPETDRFTDSRKPIQYLGNSYVTRDNTFPDSDSNTHIFVEEVASSPLGSIVTRSNIKYVRIADGETGNPNSPPELILTEEPISQVVTAPASVDFSANASISGGNGTEVISYQWQKSDSDNPSQWDILSGETSSTLTLPSTSWTDDQDKYRCVISSGDLIPITTKYALLQVLYPTVSLNSNPSSATVTMPSGTSFTVSFTLNEP